MYVCVYIYIYTSNNTLYNVTGSGRLSPKWKRVLSATLRMVVPIIIITIIIFTHMYISLSIYIYIHIFSVYIYIYIYMCPVRCAAATGP